ncbi:phytanoyl-CoA dioxygenase family protein [Phycisphaera mikurensis]|uniref:Phytanoyl-CoA dioxygenase family protein n=1 Tax=Phycisphaera mikurensis (strain NBRC 102666 / KCTC 22515 / FYK2301M01) TaxID=1142394 RepID=I0IDP8_PHYMF|nr:phytanoyl-CoA dioxygenase family protein [Phycisphaera mikurensis]MBB6441203.1 hypothetical protein [Phycisphaera mikurensis]BAM03386.1 hypothetical protein PSMK_12270 [Phycisphaera mikurensis NBRC 102666]
MTALAPQSPPSSPDAPVTLPLAPDPANGRDLSDAEADYLFDVQGYRILRNVLSPLQLEKINGWVDRQDTDRLESGDWVGDVEVHTYGSKDGLNFQNIMEADNPVFQELIDQPAWIDQVRRYIVGDSTQHRLSIDECFLNLRRGGGFIPTHSGGDSVRFTGLFQWLNGKWAVGQINILMALDDIGPGDGGTTLIPGSHKQRFGHPLATESGKSMWDLGASGVDTLGMCEVNLNAGDAVMFTDGICHGSMPRTNPGERRIMVYRYSPQLLANRLNYIPSDEFLARLTEAQRAIVQPVPPRGRPGRTLTFQKGSGVGG